MRTKAQQIIRLTKVTRVIWVILIIWLVGSWSFLKLLPEIVDLIILYYAIALFLLVIFLEIWIYSLKKNNTN